MPFLINRKRISVYQALFLRAGYQAMHKCVFPGGARGLAILRKQIAYPCAKYKARKSAISVFWCVVHVAPCI